MARLLIAFLLLMPLSAYAQTEFELPGGNEIRAYFNAPDSGASAPAPLVIIMGGVRVMPALPAIPTAAMVRLSQIAAGRLQPRYRRMDSHSGVIMQKTVRQLIALLKQRDDIADGPVLLMGISNGGISSLEIASNHPGDYLGIIAVPALASSRSQLRALQNFPVYLRIGSEDRLGWGNRFDATVDVLEGVGVRLDAKLLLGRGHTFPLDWDDLEPWLQSLQID